MSNISSYSSALTPRKASNAHTRGGDAGEPRKERAHDRPGRELASAGWVSAMTWDAMYTWLLHPKRLEIDASRATLSQRNLST